MEPPFPGMDPYLEAPNIWPDVHTSLAFAIRSQIQPLLSPRYSAAIVPYGTFEPIDIMAVRTIVADVAILERDVPSAVGAATVVMPAPLTGTLAMDLPTRYTRIEIRAIGSETLVTVIELLSPVNKRPGIDGADAYDFKRRDILRSAAHLVEIDLLRAGRRPAFVTPLPNDPYFIFLSRAERRPTAENWPIGLRNALPSLPIPLRRPDLDVILDLGAALRLAYSSARYDLRIDYQADPPPPALPPTDAAWLAAHLREHGLRE